MFSKKATKNYKIFTVDLTLTKGQIILKGLFGVLEFSQKTNEFVMVVVKMNLFVYFWANLRIPEVPSELSDLYKGQIYG